MAGPFDAEGIGQHDPQKLPVDLAVQFVHRVVVLDDGARKGRIVAHKGVHGTPDHPAGLLPQALEAALREDGGVHDRGAPGDIAAVIADALDLGDDFQAGGDETQVRGRGRVEGQQIHAELIELELPFIQLAIQLVDALGLGGGPLGQRLDGQLDHVFCDAGHRHDAVAQVLEFRVEVAHQPNLPVM
jgi:hypothetical protein